MIPGPQLTLETCSRFALIFSFGIALPVCKDAVLVAPSYLWAEGWVYLSLWVGVGVADL